MMYNTRTMNWKGVCAMAEREKSALYPGITWNEAIDFIKRINSLNLKAVSYQALAEKYGLKSPSTRSFMARIGAAKQFGLIVTTQGSTVQLTEASRQILYPTGEQVREVELSCFAQPPLYAKLISKYDGLALPSTAILSNILMSEYRISRAAKDSAAKCFVDSAEQLEILKGGVLCYSEAMNEQIAPETAQKIDSEEKNEQLNEGEEEVPQSVTPSVISASEADYISQSIPFESGKIAKFIIPIDATEDDLLLLHDMFDVLLKRKFKIDI